MWLTLLVQLLLAPLLSQAQCDFSCFLGRLTLPLPPVSFEGSILFSSYHVELSGGACHSFGVGSVLSSPSSSSALLLGLSQLVFQCSGGSWKANLGLLQAHGVYNVSSSGSAATAQIALEHNASSHIVDQVLLSQCNVSALVQAYFAGPRWFDDVEKHLHVRLEAYIGAVIAKDICNFLRQQVVDAYLNNVVVSSINTRIHDFLLPPLPQMVPVPLNENICVLQNNPAVELLQFIVARVVGPGSLNRAVRSLPFNGTRLTLPLATGVLDAGDNITVALESLSMSGMLDSWTALSVNPIDLFMLQFEASLEGPVMVSLQYRYNVTRPLAQFNAAGLANATFSNVTFRATLTVLADCNFFSPRLSWHELVSCPSSGILGLNVSSILGGLIVQNVTIQNMEISNKTLLEQEFDVLLNRAIALVLQNYVEFLPAIIDSILDTTGRQLLQDVLQQSLENSTSVCGTDSDEPYYGLNLLTLSIVMPIAGALSIVVALLIACFRPPQYSSLHNALAFEQPLWAQILVPTVIFFLLAANMVTATSTAAVLQLRLSVGRGVIVSSVLYEMTLKSSVDAAWSAGVYQMALVLVLFQVILPYSKIIAMCVCFYTPISPRYRFWILSFFNYCGRFQLISGFIQVLYSIAFHFSLNNQVESFIVVHIDFWIFMLIGVVSMVLNWYMLCLTRPLSDKRSMFGLDDGDDEPDSACQCNRSKALLWVASLVALGMLVAGLYVESFSLKFRGLGGYVLSLLGVEQVRPFSIIAAGLELRDGWLDPNSLPAVLLQICFFLLAVAMPLAQALSCMLALLAIRSKWAYWILEATSTWASLDVFLVAVLASVLSLSQYASFMVGGRCDSINAALEKLHPPIEPVCIDVTSELGPGVYLLAIAVLLLLVASQLILLLMRRKLIHGDVSSLGTRYERMIQ